MAVELATNELSAVNDAPFRNLLISNFEDIQDLINNLLLQLRSVTNELSEVTSNINSEVDNKLSAQDQVTVNRLKQQAQELNARINRIVLGTDNEMIEQVVTQILKDKGVIN